MAVQADDVDLQRDRDLVERFQAGDEAAFEELYRRYYRRLARFCQKRVIDRHEAEDLAQEAFARALSAMPHFDGERRFYPWVSVIAARLCIDSHRRLARTVPDANPDPGATDVGPDRLEAAVDLALLARAMERLGPRHREVLELRERSGLSYQQIADHYQVSMGTVETLLFRARRALRREFLAVSGDDGRGRLAALVPLAGLVRWLRAGVSRRLASARDRLVALSGQLAPVAGSVSFAVATTAAGLVGGVAGSSGGPVPIPAAALAVARSTPPEVAASATPASRYRTTGPGGAGSTWEPATSQQAAAPSPGPPAALVRVGGASVTKDGSAARQASQMPVHLTTGPVNVGTDPSAVVDANSQALLEWLHSLPRTPTP